MESESKVSEGEHPGATHSMEFLLNPQQLTYISSLLPLRYSLQISSRGLKKGGNTGSATGVKPGRKKNPSRLDDSERQEDAPRRRHNIEEPVSLLHATEPPLAENNTTAPEEFECEPEMAPCYYILNRLKRYQCAEPFLQEVDPVALGVPDYPKVIKEPMDLGLIERNLRSNQYQTPTQFHADLNKVFTNSYRYNSKGSDVYKLTVELERHYNKMLAQVSLQENASELHNRLALTNRKVGQFVSTHAPKKRKKHHQQERVLTEVQINNLSLKIKQLPNHCLAEVMKIVTESRSFGASNHPIRNIQEMDLMELEMAVLVELDRYVRLKVSPQVRRRKPKEPKLTPERSTGSGKPAEVAKPPAHLSSVESSFQAD